VFGFKITLPLRGVANDIFKVRGLQNTTRIRRANDESFVSGFRCVMAIGAALALRARSRLLFRSNASAVELRR